MKFKICPLENIKWIKSIKRTIQLSQGGIVLTHFGEVKGFLISVREYLKLVDNYIIEIEDEKVMTLNFFIDLVKKGDVNLFNESAINLTYQTREIMVFVNSKYTAYLPIPILRNFEL